MNPIIVGVNKVDISTKEQPIIGTQALVTCVSVLIYNKKQKKSVVLHASSDWESVLLDALSLLLENNLLNIENYYKALNILKLHNIYDLYNINQETKTTILNNIGLMNIKVDIGEILEVTIIPGYYQDNYNIRTNMIKYFTSLTPLIKINTVPKNAVKTNMFGDTGSHEFYFDSSLGKYVTNKIKNDDVSIPLKKRLSK